MKKTLSGATLAVVLLVAAACGGGEDETADATSTTAATRTAGQSQGTPAGSGKPIVLENATTTASGLKYVDTVVGTGVSPRADQQVTIHYSGRLAADGKQFDSSAGGRPVTFPMGNVIPGFAEALSTMKVGGKRTVVIPAALGYGNRPVQGIPANSDLVFDIELLAIK